VINRISSWAIHILSLFAMCLVVGATALTKIGRLHQSRDEGTGAHLFQLAVALLVPAGIVYLLTADWRKPLRVALRLVAPAIALIIAFSTLYYMEHAFRR
jgi:hypothetical protein